MKVYALSLGCPKNLIDTERFLADLVGKRWEVIAEPDGADVLFLNTCAFLSEAVVESKKFLRDLISVKKRFPEKKIYLAGCLVSRIGKSLLSEFPEIDRLITPQEIASFPNRFLCTPGHYAYLKVSDGCDNRCRYCLIPSLRGPLKSYPMERLIAEAHTLTAGGVRELNICAQDTTGYGIDLYGKPVLDKLLREICRIKDLRWVRLLYTYPTGYNRQLIEALQNEKVCPYLDIPLQHASDRILSAMGRRGSQKEYRKLIAKLRRAIPDLTLRTTFIVGYPGETEDDFRILLDFIEEIEFEKLGLFAYSAETGTPAADLPQVPQPLKEERLEELGKVQAKISQRKLTSFIGREVEAVVEDVNPEDKKKSVGRTIFDAPEVDGSIILDRLVPTGTFVRVNVTGADSYDLYGQVIQVL
ncbi:MAG: 30S ribosomal protein S12 methylthiotransferase RimO [Candidatus Omnitrophica bacterium]|nr:30S ribosomal protein S12 methylthiotransferase RimO [Candidatus Omnitrophota bacterium]